MLPVMAESPDHEARITSLEADVSGLRTEFRDFREHNARLHNATRQDIRDLRQDMTDLRSRVDDGFIEMRGKFDATAAAMQQIVGMLTTLIDRDDK
jgi:hypothetical protein